MSTYISQLLYPFKFLDAYTKEDQNIFFGREEEIEKLFKACNNAQVVLLYGASGAGKTSLVQCGLAKKLHRHSWIDIYIRRGKNINTALEETLSRYEAEDSGQNLLSEEMLSPLEHQLQQIYLEYFRPIYLVFDQFEELFILGSKEEQEQFYQNLEAILAAKQEVKLLFSIREEYLGHLHAMHRRIPQLFEQKIRVEPMSLAKVATVLKGINQLPNSLVHIPQGEESQLAQALAQKLRGNRQAANISLPYLQVILDKLYRTESGDWEQQPQREASLTLNSLQRLADMDDILRDFLEERIQVIATNSGKEVDQYKEQLWTLLMPFVSLEGTKIPRGLEELDQALKMPQAFIQQAVQALTNNRILRYREEEDLYELAHDALALSIAERRTDEEVELLEIKRYIQSQIGRSRQLRELISAKWLQRIQPLEAKLNLTAEELGLLQDSRAAVEAKIQRKRLLRKLIVGIILGVIGILSLLTLWALWEKRASEQAQKEAQELLIKAEENAAQAKLAQSKAVANKKAVFSAQRASIEQKYKNYIETIEQLLDNPASSLASVEKEGRSFWNLANDLTEEHSYLDGKALLELDERLKDYEQAGGTKRKMLAARQRKDWVETLRYFQLYEQEQRMMGRALVTREQEQLREAEILGTLMQQMILMDKGGYTNSNNDYIKLEDYRIAPLPCSRALWKLIMGSVSTRTCPECAVENVRLEDIYVFFERLSAKTGEHFRLASFDEFVAGEKYASGVYRGGIVMATKYHKSTRNSKVLIPYEVNLYGYVYKPDVEWFMSTNRFDTRSKIGSFSMAYTISKKAGKDRILKNYTKVANGEHLSSELISRTDTILVKYNLSTFYMSKYEVTFEDYDQYCEATAQPKPSDMGWGRGKRPVINVSWEDANKYAKWLSLQKGVDLRLPTRFEWEYAARGGHLSQNYIYSGSNSLDQVAWYYNNAQERTHKVGEKRANELGIYDLSGNVAEWCSSEALYPLQNAYMINGGGWISLPIKCKHTSHLNCGKNPCPTRYDGAKPGYRSSLVGFRLVYTP